MRRVLAIIGLVAACGTATAIPLKSVTLFTSGVGEFLHEATVVGSGTLELTVTVEAMDDVLRSLTVVDHDGGIVSVAEYPNGESTARRLGRFPIDLGATFRLGQLLNQLRGTEVEAEYTPDGEEHSRTMRGTIVGSDLATAGHERLLLAAEGRLTEIAVRSIGDLTLLDGDRVEELEDALAALRDASADSGLRTIAISYEGTGRRRLTVRYLREMPIWRTSYRVVTDEEEALVQGWAHIDNTSSLDWHDVELTIVSASPNTYRFPIYEPQYATRARGTGPGLAEPPAPSSRAFAGSARAEMEESAYDYLADTVVPRAQTQVLQSGIAFTFPQPVTIRRGDAAMVPLVQEEMPAQLIRIYDPRRHADSGEASIRFENTSETQLPGGPVTIYEGARYVGDAVLPLLAAGEMVTLTYAGDINYRVTRRQDPVQETLRTLRIADGILIAERLARRTWVYEIERRGAVPSEGDHPDGATAATPLLEIEHPQSNGWEVTSPRNGIQRPGTIRFTARPPRLTVIEEQVLEQRYALTSMNETQLSFYSTNRVADPAVRRILSDITRLRTALAERTAERSALEARRTEIYRDQERVRGNMAVLDHDSALYRRYSRELAEQEDELDRLDSEIATAIGREREARAALAGYIETL